MLPLDCFKLSIQTRKPNKWLEKPRVNWNRGGLGHHITAYTAPYVHWTNIPGTSPAQGIFSSLWWDRELHLTRQAVSAGRHVERLGSEQAWGTIVGQGYHTANGVCSVCQEERGRSQPASHAWKSTCSQLNSLSLPQDPCRGMPEVIIKTATQSASFSGLSVF
jgi:hypothetical protein